MEKQRNGISQEGLKLIACVTMLIDHIGATVIYDMYASAWQANLTQKASLLFYIYYAFRIIGRIAFPIYCFLLSEGAYHTHDPKKYGLRLLVGAILAEIPFDLALFGQISFEHQSVMITLLLGFVTVQCIRRVKGVWQILVLIPFCLLAEWLNTDYGSMGVAMVALFWVTRGVKYEKLIRIAGMAILCWDGGIEIFAVASMLPIALYHGRKLSWSKSVQRAFYLFYPVHLVVLWIVSMI